MTDLVEEEKVLVDNSSSPAHSHTDERVDILTRSPAKDESLFEKEEEEIEIEAPIHVEHRDTGKDEKSPVIPTNTNSTNNTKNSSFLIDQILSKTSKNLNRDEDDENDENEEEPEGNVSLNETAKLSTKASQNSPCISSSSSSTSSSSSFEINNHNHTQLILNSLGLPTPLTSLQSSELKCNIFWICFINF